MCRLHGATRVGLPLVAINSANSVRDQITTKLLMGWVK